MSEYDKNKGFSINQILHIVKIASLFFSAVAFFQYYFKDKDIYDLLTNNYIVFLAVLCFLLLIYIFWNYIQTQKNDNYFIINWVQPAIFFIISLSVIMLTGAYQSNYKFLFLFIIISSTIESGTKSGMIISSLSAFFILFIDLIFVPSYVNNTYFESDIVLACAFVIIAWTIGFYVRTEKEHINTLKNLVNVDGLTGLFNHRFFYDTITQKMNEARINGTQLSLLFIDIDYFKNYNDMNGHQKGDEVLKMMSETLLKHAREGDVVARYGGEEFAIILPETSEGAAIEIGEKIRIAIEEQEFPQQEYMPTGNLTVSIGVSVFPDKAKSEIEIIKYADEALYRAKFLSKNSVESYFSILDDLQKDVDENDKELITSVKTLIAVINAKDKYTYNHVERVVSYCRLMAEKMKLDEHSTKIFIYAAYMHDIGKINIPEDILIKSTPLTDEEWEVLKGHSRNGAEIIKNVAVLKEVYPIILQHHERFDGMGYPLGLKGEKILYLARMLTITDSFDAMTSNRPYQKTRTYAEAMEELGKCSGSQFDPELVQMFISAIKEGTQK